MFRKLDDHPQSRAFLSRTVRFRGAKKEKYKEGGSCHNPFKENKAQFFSGKTSFIVFCKKWGFGLGLNHANVIYPLLVLLIACSCGNVSKDEKIIEWSQEETGPITLDIERSDEHWKSNVMVFSSPFVVGNAMPENLSLNLLEYDLNDSLLRRSQVWMKNDFVVDSVKDRKFRLIAKVSNPGIIDSETVSDNIILITGADAKEQIKLIEKKFVRSASRVFTRPNTYDNPLYIAHRGYAVDAPENSIPSFFRAGQMEAWAIEGDLRFTKDSVLVCIHDKTIDSRYNGTGKVSDYTYAELLEMKIVVGNNVEAYSDEELRVPTLEQYFEICKKYNSVAFIEMKEDASKEVIDLANRTGMTGRYIVSSSNIDILTHFRSLSDEVIHHINMKPTSSYLNDLRLMGNASTSFDLYDPKGKDKEIIDKCHSMGLKVCFRAVDTPEYAKKCIDGGLDFLPSNTMAEINE